jgi:hypothetical protein
VAFLGNGEAICTEKVKNCTLQTPVYLLPMANGSNRIGGSFHTPNFSRKDAREKTGDVNQAGASHIFIW